MQYDILKSQLLMKLSTGIDGSADKKKILNKNMLHVCTSRITLNLHAYMHTYIHAYMNTYMHTCIHAYMHTCIHAYIHTYMHAYMHT